MEKRTVGRNVEAIVDGHILTLVIDLSQSVGPSKSGKNTLVASTSGNFMLPSGEKVGVNVFRAASR